MRASYFIQSGQVIKINSNNQDKAGLFSLEKWLKKMFTRFHVGFSDDCCTIDGSDNDTTNIPVTYDKGTGHFYYYDASTGAKVQITGF